MRKIVVMSMAIIITLFLNGVSAMESISKEGHLVLRAVIASPGLNDDTFCFELTEENVLWVRHGERGDDIRSADYMQSVVEEGSIALTIEEVRKIQGLMVSITAYQGTNYYNGEERLDDGTTYAVDGGFDYYVLIRDKYFGIPSSGFAGLKRYDIPELVQLLDVLMELSPIPVQLIGHE